MWWALKILGSHPCGTTSTVIDVTGDNVMLLQKFSESWIALRCWPASHVIPCDHVLVFVKNPIWFQLGLLHKMVNHHGTNGRILVGGSALEANLRGPILLHWLPSATHCWKAKWLESFHLLDQKKCLRRPVRKFPVGCSQDQWLQNKCAFLWLKEFFD